MERLLQANVLIFIACLLLSAGADRQRRLRSLGSAMSMGGQVRSITRGVFNSLGRTTFATMFLIVVTISCSPSSDAGWVGTWAASPAPAPSGFPELQDQTLREIIHVSVGGIAVRVTFSNLFGTQTLSLAKAHVAIRNSGSSIVQTTDRILTFNGSTSCSIPAGGFLTSDALAMSVPALADLAVSLYLSTKVSNPTVHPFALETTYISQGDQTGDAEFETTSTITSWAFLTNVDVHVAETNAAIVALGDSITDGFGSTVDANHRWTDIVAARLIAPTGKGVAVLNAGLSGNRILHDAPEGYLWYGPDALNRFDRDVLGQSGVRFVVVLEGINDIGLPGYLAPESEQVTSAQIISGLLQLIQRAHSRGIKIYGGTLLPFEGAIYPGFYSASKESEREAVNDWMRSRNSFDAVIDFDRALRDPNHPTRLLTLYDSGDHVHPNDAGYSAMGSEVDLHLFDLMQ
jgi:lysophospholipase L1-like esterase